MVPQDLKRCCRNIIIAQDNNNNDILAVCRWEEPTGRRDDASSVNCRRNHCWQLWRSEKPSSEGGGEGRVVFVYTARCNRLGTACAEIADRQKSYAYAPRSIGGSMRINVYALAETSPSDNCSQSRGHDMTYVCALKRNR